MRDLILVTNNNYSLTEFESILKENISDSIVRRYEDRISLEFKKEGELFGEIAQIEIAPEVEQFHEPEELEYLRKVIPHPCFYFIHFKEINHAKEIIKYLANRDDVFVDPDSGEFIPGKKFIQMCEERPNWDWARD